MLALLGGTYGPFVCYAFTVNYILGVGCLGIPYAFLRCGPLFGSVIVISLSCVTYITVMWVAVASQQEIQLSLYLSSTNPFILSPKLQSRKTAVGSDEEKQPLKSLGMNTFYSSVSQYLGVQEERPRITAEEGKAYLDKKRRERDLSKKGDHDEAQELEVTDLASEFLGPWGKLTYQTSLMMLTYVGLLAYTQVFNSSFISQLWPSAGSLLPAALFALMVVPLSCFDLAEQITVQVLMSLLRFLSLGVLLVGTLVAFWTFPPGEENTFADSEPTPLVEPGGFGLMFTTAIFSQLFQHSVPGLIRPLSNEHKKHVPMIFKLALLTTSVIYISTGCACVAYFGRNLRTSVNLNFVGFTWGHQGHSLDTIIVHAVSMMVVLFPALDTLSVFPLIANTLGNNLNSAFPGLAHWVRSAGITERSAVRRTTLIIWRLVAAIPPIVASIFVSDLILSLQIAGICGIVVALVIPALLQRQYEFRVGLVPTSVKAMSPIPDKFSGSFYPTAVLALAAVALAVSVFQMFT